MKSGGILYTKSSTPPFCQKVTILRIRDTTRPEDVVVRVCEEEWMGLHVLTVKESYLFPSAEECLEHQVETLEKVIGKIKGEIEKFKNISKGDC